MLVAAAGVLYRLISRCRRALYRAGILRSRRLPRPVISVGNIAAGGAGKTPAVIAIANFLSAAGYRVAVLTRGYGRRGEGGVVRERDPDRYGDEPVLIKERTNADVIVGANRSDSADDYLRSNQCDIFVLDDGFQHHQLHRDIDLVIDVPNAPFHREGRSALRDADLVAPRRLTLSVPEHVRAKQLFAFSGLADNDQFFGSLRAAGLKLAGTLAFGDHHRYSPEDLKRIERAAREAGAEAIVTTEKDAVKIDRRDMIPVRADFVFEPGLLEELLARLRR